MKSSTTFTAEGRLNTKRERALDCQKPSIYNKAASTYKSNNTKEELCLEYINSFIQPFVGIHPKRKVPYMITENEYGTNKFVCTTIRPTQVSYSELDDMFECASFLAGYILYEPLDPQTEPPSILFSPTETLEKHTGDSYDIATLLCSFLIGSGYDAYVVSGYAPRHVTLRDQSSTQCPMLAMINDTLGKLNLTEHADRDEDDDNPYKPIDNTVKSSNFLAEQAEQKRITALDTFKLWIPDEAPVSSSSKASDDDLIDGKPRMHAWVLVLAGRRDVREHVFLEPSTGRAYSLVNSPYTGIEAVWNSANYWVNLEVEKKISELDFDFANTASWEYLFISGARATTETNADGGDIHQDSFSETKASDSGPKSSSDVMRTFDAPPSYADALKLDRKSYLLRYPPIGRRTVQYYCSKVDYFAKNTHAQCMVMRATFYLDAARTIVKEIHEWYENRGDKLYKRVRSFLNKTKVTEYFHPGSVGEVKQWVTYPGKRSEVDFYVSGRLDHMKRREVDIGQRVVEHFEGRSDNLNYRATLLTIDKNVAGARQFALPGGGLAPELFILKMTQKFDRDPTVTAGTDIAKRTFYVREGKLVVQYHSAKSQITGKVKTYLHTRGPSIPGVTEQAFAQEVGVVEDLEALQEATALEREGYTQLKVSFQQMAKVEESRIDSERQVSNERSVFENALDKVDKASLNESKNVEKSSSKDSKGSDWLTPYLRNVKDPNNITKEEAMEVKQSVLDAFKARLIERASIIQSRLSEENMKLGREQERFQRSQREGDLSTEEYERYCTEAMFRIQILEQRLQAHDASAAKKFGEMEEKLNMDPRLRALRTM